jgi:FkbH-like protein
VNWRGWLRSKANLRLSQAVGSYHQQLLSPGLQQNLTPRRVHLFGGCLAEYLACRAKALGWRMEHVLYQSGLHELPALSNNAKPEAILVVLSLRTILGQAAQELVGFHDADLLYQKDLDPDAVISSAQNVLDGLLQHFTDAMQSGPPVFFLSFIEPPATSSGLFTPRQRGGIYQLVHALNNHLAARLSQSPSSYYLEINDLLRAEGDAGVYDGYDLCFAHGSLRSARNENPLPGRILLRLDQMLSVLAAEQPVKLIITDLDNTLWKGVLAEEDHIVPGDHTEGWPIGYAEALIECKRRGIVLAICSKNEEAQTRANFDKVWYGRIRWEDFAVTRVNWQPKSQNVREILQAVNVLPEHTVFIDDNPLEITEVIRAFPQMRTLTGDPHTWRMELLYGVPYQVPRLSAESQQRTEAIQAKVQRDSQLASGDREGYLRELGLAVDILTLDLKSPQFARALELLNKTNQFNTTGQRWTMAEMGSFVADGGRLYALRARDRMTEHGLVGLALLQGNRLRQLVLSCRVFGLGLEDALLQHLCRQGDQGQTLRADWVDTGRNATARQFLEQHFLPQEDVWQLRGAPGWPEHIAVLR